MNSVAVAVQQQAPELDYVQWALTVNCGDEVFRQSACTVLLCIHVEN
jgi:hypothetical protein